MTKTEKATEHHAPSDGNSRGWPGTGPLLGSAHHIYQTRVVQVVRSSGHRAIRPAHLTILRFLDVEGTRTSELARRGAMTKQAMGQLVREFETMGYVRLDPDPTDRRAKLVIYTETGRHLADAANRAVETVQGEFKKAAGKGGLKEVRRVLTRIVEQLTPA